MLSSSWRLAVGQQVDQDWKARNKRVTSQNDNRVTPTIRRSNKADSPKRTQKLDRPAAFGSSRARSNRRAFMAFAFQAASNMSPKIGIAPRIVSIPRLTNIRRT